MSDHKTGGMTNPTLRDEIAQALYERVRIPVTPWSRLLISVREHYYVQADAVIAVMQKHGYLSKGP